MLFVVFTIVLSATNSLVYSNQCLEGWNYFAADKICIKSFDTRKTFNEARATCQSFGGDLVMIKSQGQLDFILTLNYPYKNWIGLFDENHDNIYAYIDGSEIGDFKPWNYKEPNNLGGNEHCAIMYGYNPAAGKWNDIDCDKEMPYICSIQIKCAEGWAYYPNDNICVKFFDTNLEYNEARKTCQSEAVNGDLAQVKDKTYMDFILDNFDLGSANWIGIQDENEDRTFHYLDGSELGEYQPWYKNEPDNDFKHENCIMVLGMKCPGQWYDVRCEYLLSFICSAENK